MKAKSWYAMFSSDVYAIQFHYTKPISERSFRKRLRTYEGAKRLPRNTQIWAGE